MELLTSVLTSDCADERVQPAALVLLTYLRPTAHDRGGRAHALLRCLHRVAFEAPRALDRRVAVDAICAIADAQSVARLFNDVYAQLLSRVAAVPTNALVTLASLAAYADADDTKTAAADALAQRYAALGLRVESQPADAREERAESTSGASADAIEQALDRLETQIDVVTNSARLSPEQWTLVDEQADGDRTLRICKAKLKRDDDSHDSMLRVAMLLQAEDASIRKAVRFCVVRPVVKLRSQLSGCRTYRAAPLAAATLTLRGGVLDARGSAIWRRVNATRL